MLKPSYAELMDVLNQNADETSNEVTSRYTIVIATAKRARQLIDGDEPMVASPDGKPVSTAVEELYQNKIKIVPKGQGTVLKIYKEKSHEEEYNKKKEIFSELEHIKIDNDTSEDDVILEDAIEDEEIQEIDDFSEDEE